MASSVTMTCGTLSLLLLPHNINSTRDTFLILKKKKNLRTNM